MRFFKKENGKKGFTLTELCAVMAITAIVGTMVVSCIMFFTNQNKQITSEASLIQEMTLCQSAINKWLKTYDNSEHEILPADNSGTPLVDDRGEQLPGAKPTQLIAVELGAGGARGATASTLKFADSTVTYDGSAHTEKCKSITGMAFDFKTVLDEDEDGAEYAASARIIKATVSSKLAYKADQKRTLLFPLFSGVTRERSVTGRNG